MAYTIERTEVLQGVRVCLDKPSVQQTEVFGSEGTHCRPHWSLLVSLVGGGELASDPR